MPATLRHFSINADDGAAAAGRGQFDGHFPDGRSRSTARAWHSPFVTSKAKTSSGFLRFRTHARHHRTLFGAM